jgi:hypothetical protein
MFSLHTFHIRLNNNFGPPCMTRWRATHSSHIVICVSIKWPSAPSKPGNAALRQPTPYLHLGGLGGGSCWDRGSNPALHYDIKFKLTFHLNTPKVHIHNHSQYILCNFAFYIISTQSFSSRCRLFLSVLP